MSILAPAPSERQRTLSGKSGRAEASALKTGTEVAGLKIPSLAPVAQTDTQLGGSRKDEAQVGFTG
ncbi:hypothetical protein [Thiocystis violacea]|uniref:hypothetical protein n=1 Tax=Thiocystis violacea TaxID=13725 RepID=UPI001A91F19D|nr:hypothetical protein [Thiocystis violacea]MBK1720960.1 hypothetical protein [Thiocystis violacea]